MSFGPGNWEAPFYPQRRECKAAYQILMRGALAASHLEIRYDSSGLDEDDEVLQAIRQDLLRAMLLFCSATLDAVVQRLLQDCLPTLVRGNPEARRSLVDYADSLLKAATSEGADRGKARRVIAESLAVGFGGGARIARHRIEELKDTSFQSFQKLCAGAAVFGIDNDFLVQDKEGLKRIFKVRNDIVHRMDIPAQQLNTAAKDAGVVPTAERQKGQVTEDCQTLLEVASGFIRRIEESLPVEPRLEGGKFFTELLKEWTEQKKPEGSGDNPGE